MRRPHAGNVLEVLDKNRHAAQQPDVLDRAYPRVDLRRGATGAIGVQVGDGVQLGLRDRGERGFECIDRAYVAAADGVGERAGVGEPGLHDYARAYGCSSSRSRSLRLPARSIAVHAIASAPS